MKRRILSLITAITMIAGLFTAMPVLAATTEYKSLDLSLTKTTYDTIGASGSIVVCPVTNGTRGVAISNGLTYSIGDDSVISEINANGTFITKGYGVTPVTITYDKGTPDNSSDDITASVMINCYDGTDDDAEQIEVYANADASLENIDSYTERTFNAKNNFANRVNIYTRKDPLDNGVIVLGPYNNNDSYAYSKKLSELNDGTAVFNGWFYDKGESTGNTFLYFGYAWTQDDDKQNANDGDGKFTYGKNYFYVSTSSYTGGAESYVVCGGSGGIASSGVKYDAATAIEDYGALTSVKRTVGWHQYTMTVDNSITHPGTDYALVKVYVDGILVTAQDIYVGNINKDNRVFGVRFSNMYSDKHFYKDVTVTKYSRSEAVAEFQPSDKATGVPLQQNIKIKFTNPVSITNDSFTLKAGSEPVSCTATLDETKTVVTISAGRLKENTTYTLTADSLNLPEYSFTTGSDSSMADMIDAMDEYKMTGTRFIDFADSSKSAEEYGVGFVRNYAGTQSAVTNSSVTFTENARESFSSAVPNGLLVRNLSPRNADVERTVVSYKFKPSEVKYFDTSFTGGLGVPYMIMDYASSAVGYKTAALRGADSTLVSPIETTPFSVRLGLLRKNVLTDTGSTATQSVSGKSVNNGDVILHSSAEATPTSYYANLIPDSDGWYRLTYVVDTDPDGKTTPVWTVVLNSDFTNEDNIYTLTNTPVYTECFTSTDSLYIPMSGKTVSSPVSVSIKDVEIYNLEKKSLITIDDAVTVKDNTTKETIYSDAIAGKTVDIELGASGDGEEYTAIFTVMDGERLAKVEVATGNFTSSGSIKLEGFKIPESETDSLIKLYVFVWDSFDKMIPYVSKIEYTALGE